MHLQNFVHINIMNANRLLECVSLIPVGATALAASNADFFHDFVVLS